MNLKASMVILYHIIFLSSVIGLSTRAGRYTGIIVAPR